MSAPAIELPLNQIAEICQRFHIKELSLFGSAMRDDFRFDSDLDFLVLFEDDSKIGIAAYADFQLALERLLNRRVDLVPKDGLKSLIRDEVLSTASVVYAAR